MPDFSKLERFAVGDLVAFHFPYADGGCKTRICVIAAQDPDLNEVIVAYGTSNLQLKNNPDNAIALFARIDWQAAGLHKATRFQVDRRIRVKLDDPRFQRRKSFGSAKVGQLAANQTRRLSTLYKSLPAVTRILELQGIHPKPAGKTRRPLFLGRGKAGQRFAASVI